MAVFFSTLSLALSAPCPAAASEQAHPVAIELVQPGREGLELTARLTEDGGIIGRNITWTVRTRDGETVFSSEVGAADVSLPPGDYLVMADYGTLNLSRMVSLPEASRMMVSFVLRAGAIRVEPRMDGDALPTLRPKSRVFALEGDEAGRLMAVNAAAGEVIRLPEGRYRVESRAGAGNAAAVTDVEVKAGRVSTIAVTLRAGIARLSFVGAPTAKVMWNVEDADGRGIARQNGLNADVALLPGTYTAKARIGAELLTATFRIAAGETRDIMLGN